MSFADEIPADDFTAMATLVAFGVRVDGPTETGYVETVTLKLDDGSTPVGSRCVEISLETGEAVDVIAGSTFRFHLSTRMLQMLRRLVERTKLKAKT